MDTLTVAELRDLLQGYPDDLPVVVGSDYGDRQHTVQANGLNELEHVTLKETGYSNTGYAINGDEPDINTQTYLMLNYSSHF